MNMGDEDQNESLSESVNRKDERTSPKEENPKETSSVQTSRRCNHRIGSRRPRLCLIFLGVIVPLFGLMLNCWLWGWILTYFESPNEVDLNDQKLAAQHGSQDLKRVASIAALKVPSICFQLFLVRESEYNLTGFLAEYLSSDALLNNLTSISDLPTVSDDVVTVNTTELKEFMSYCIDAAAPFVGQLVTLAAETLQIAASQSLTFNWIRCSNGTDFGRDSKSLRLPAQTEHYRSEWDAQRSELYQKYLEQNLNLPNMTLVEAKGNAYARSLRDASGRAACRPNSVGSAFFFFTVMTTVGYGNQATETAGGRAIVFTIGFVSICAFGVLLMTAGTIVSAILDNTLRRYKFLFRFAHDTPEAAAGWGCTVGLWMLVLAEQTRIWKVGRLGDKAFSLATGYWFSYITYTTVGLGDVILEPEVLLAQDLFAFAVTMLFGFALMSAFLGKLGALFPRTIRRSWTHSMIKQLEQDSSDGGDHREDNAAGEELDGPQNDGSA